MEMLSAPLPLTQLTLDENSVDIEDVRNKLRTDSIMLNGALKKLYKDWDFSDVLRPLLTDQGPAFTQIPRLRKQMERMIKIRDDFLRNEQERKEQERKEQEQRAAPLPAAAPKRPRESSKRHADSLQPSIQSIPQNCITVTADADRTSETPITPSIPQNTKEAPISMPTRCTWQAANPDTLPPIKPS